MLLAKVAFGFFIILPKLKKYLLCKLTVKRILVQSIKYHHTRLGIYDEYLQSDMFFRNILTK